MCWLLWEPTMSCVMCEWVQWHDSTPVVQFVCSWCAESHWGIVIHCKVIFQCSSVVTVHLFVSQLVYELDDIVVSQGISMSPLNCRLTWPHHIYTPLFIDTQHRFLACMECAMLTLFFENTLQLFHPLIDDCCGGITHWMAGATCGSIRKYL